MSMYGSATDSSHSTVYNSFLLVIGNHVKRDRKAVKSTPTPLIKLES